MRCIGSLTAEYRERMHALFDLYRQARKPAEPVVCIDEKSKQILRSSRPELALRPGQCAKQDYEYVCGGTRNIFMAVEPLGGHREATVTVRRTKSDFVHFVCGLLRGTYQHVETQHQQGHPKLELHSRQRRYKTRPSLCNATYVSPH